MDKFELLKKYKELLDQGIISNEEFEAKKREILTLPDEVGSENEVVEPKFEIVEETLDELPSMDSETENSNESEVESYDIGISDGWEDSAENANSSMDEAPVVLVDSEKRPIKKVKKGKWKKLLKRVLIGIGAVIGLLIIIVIIGIMGEPDLGDVEKMNDDTLHSMNYQIPEGWDLVDDNDTSKLYALVEDDTLNAMLEVSYKGEEDLSGDAGANEEACTNETAEEKFEDCDSEHGTVSADNSLFEVTAYYNLGTVRGADSLVSAVTESFDTEGYDNPREVTKTEVEYSGATTAGTVIDKDCKDISVTQYFNTGVAKGYKPMAWTSDDSVKLKAGETSSFTVKVNGKAKTIKIECSTMTKSQYKEKCKKLNYKDQLREDDIGTYVYIEGNVLQDCGSGYFRISSNGSYDDVYMVYAEDADIVEDDWVECYGITSGIYKYETVLGAEQKVPSMIAKYVDR